MTKFRIIGCNKESGEEVDFVIESTSYLEAQKKANDLGCLVSDVRPANKVNTKLKQKTNFPIADPIQKHSQRPAIWSAISREILMLIGRAIVTFGYFISFAFMFLLNTAPAGGEFVLILLLLAIVIVILLPERFRKSKSTLSFLNRISLFYYLTWLIKYFFKNA